MAAELSYLHKLYNRGVDIGVGVTTSLFVALVGLAFWKLKLLMELHSDKKVNHRGDLSAFIVPDPARLSRPN